MKVTTLQDKYGYDYCLYTNEEFFIGEGDPDDAVLSFRKKGGSVMITDKDKDFRVALTQDEAMLLFKALTKWVEGDA